MLVSFYPIGAQEIKKRTIPEADARNNFELLLSNIYQESKKYNFGLKEDYVETVSKESWPDVKYILERRFVITDK